MAEQQQPLEQAQEQNTAPKRFGTRDEVFNGQATQTKGKLTKNDLVFENGRYKSKKAVERGRALISQIRGEKK